jgi:hypothetical protein
MQQTYAMLVANMKKVNKNNTVIEQIYVLNKASDNEPFSLVLLSQANTAMANELFQMEKHHLFSYMKNSFVLQMHSSNEEYNYYPSIFQRNFFNIFFLFF